MAPLLSNNMTGFIIAMAGSLICSFFITLSINKISVKKSKNMVGEQKANKVAG